jgi:hypothetical protein
MKGIVALCTGLALAGLIGTLQPARSDEVQDFYIKTVHLDGNTSTKGDPITSPSRFPQRPCPWGRPCPEQARCRGLAFTFEPSQIVVKAGETIRLHFVGVQGTSHQISLEGEGIDQKFALERGTMHTVELKPEKAGIIEIECYDHQPSMRGEIVVLPQ